MRKVTYGVGCSLDGYIAGVDDEVDWLHWSDDVARLSTEYWATIDTVLMGRRTYEAALNAGTRAYPGVANYVFSRTIDPGDYPEVTVVADDAASFTARLRTEEGRGVCVMGGGRIAAALMDAGVLDEIVLNVHPILLGDGIPVFPGTARTALELMRSEPLEGGCTLLTYRPAGGGRE